MESLQETLASFWSIKVIVSPIGEISSQQFDEYCQMLERCSTVKLPGTSASNSRRSIGERTVHLRIVTAAESLGNDATTESSRVANERYTPNAVYHFLQAHRQPFAAIALGNIDHLDCAELQILLDDWKDSVEREFQTKIPLHKMIFAFNATADQMADPNLLSQKELEFFPAATAPEVRYEQLKAHMLNRLHTLAERCVQVIDQYLKTTERSGGSGISTLESLGVLQLGDDTVAQRHCLSPRYRSSTAPALSLSPSLLPTDSSHSRKEEARKWKEKRARLKKWRGDLRLLSGCPADAEMHYAEAKRSCAPNDHLWVGAACMGIAAARACLMQHRRWFQKSTSHAVPNRTTLDEDELAHITSNVEEAIARFKQAGLHLLVTHSALVLASYYLDPMIMPKSLSNKQIQKMKAQASSRAAVSSSDPRPVSTAFLRRKCMVMVNLAWWQITTDHDPHRLLLRRVQREVAAVAAAMSLRLCLFRKFAFFAHQVAKYLFAQARSVGRRRAILEMACTWEHRAAQVYLCNIGRAEAVESDSDKRLASRCPKGNGFSVLWHVLMAFPKASAVQVMELHARVLHEFHTWLSFDQQWTIFSRISGPYIAVVRPRFFFGVQSSAIEDKLRPDQRVKSCVPEVTGMEALMLEPPHLRPAPMLEGESMAAVWKKFCSSRVGGAVNFLMQDIEQRSGPAQDTQWVVGANGHILVHLRNPLRIPITVENIRVLVHGGADVAEVYCRSAKLPETNAAVVTVRVPVKPLKCGQMRVLGCETVAFNCLMRHYLDTPCCLNTMPEAPLVQLTLAGLDCLETAQELEEGETSSHCLVIGEGEERTLCYTLSNIGALPVEFMRVSTVVKRWGLTKDGRRATFAKETCSVTWQACTYDCKDGGGDDDGDVVTDATGDREPMQDPDPSVHWHVDGFHALRTLLRGKEAFLPTQRVELRARVRGDLRLKNVDLVVQYGSLRQHEGSQVQVVHREVRLPLRVSCERSITVRRMMVLPYAPYGPPMAALSCGSVVSDIKSAPQNTTRAMADGDACVFMIEVQNHADTDCICHCKCRDYNASSAWDSVDEMKSDGDGEGGSEREVEDGLWCRKECQIPPGGSRTLTFLLKRRAFPHGASASEVRNTMFTNDISELHWATRRGQQGRFSISKPIDGLCHYMRSPLLITATVETMTLSPTPCPTTGDEAVTSAALSTPTSDDAEAVTDDAGAPANDAEAATDDAGAPADDADAATDDAGAPADDADAATDDAGAPADDAEAATDDAGAPADDAEAATDDAGAPADDADAATDDAGAPADDAEAVTDDAGAPANDAEAATDDAGAPADDAEAATDDEDEVTDDGNGDDDDDVAALKSDVLSAKLGDEDAADTGDAVEPDADDSAIKESKHHPSIGDTDIPADENDAVGRSSANADMASANEHDPVAALQSHTVSSDSSLAPTSDSSAPSEVDCEPQLIALKPPDTECEAASPATAPSSNNTSTSSVIDPATMASLGPNLVKVRCGELLRLTVTVRSGFVRHMEALAGHGDDKGTQSPLQIDPQTLWRTKCGFLRVVVFQRLGERIVDLTSDHIVDAPDSEKLNENKLNTKIAFAGSLQTPLPQEVLSVGGGDDHCETDPYAVIRHEVMLACVNPGRYEIGVKCKLNQRPRSLQLGDTEADNGDRCFDLWWHSTLHAQVSQ